MSQNEKFNEQNNGYALAFYIFGHCVVVRCKTATWNDQVVFLFLFGIDRWHYIFSLSKFLDRLEYWADSDDSKFEGEI